MLCATDHADRMAPSTSGASGVTDVRLSVGDQGGSASAACRRARPFLGHLVTAHVNKKAFKPAAKDIKAKYYMTCSVARVKTWTWTIQISTSPTFTLRSRSLSAGTGPTEERSGARSGFWIAKSQLGQSCHLSVGEIMGA